MQNAIHILQSLELRLAHAKLTGLESMFVSFETADRFTVMLTFRSDVDVDRAAAALDNGVPAVRSHREEFHDRTWWMKARAECDGVGVLLFGPMHDLVETAQPEVA